MVSQPQCCLISHFDSFPAIGTLTKTRSARTPESTRICGTLVSVRILSPSSQRSPCQRRKLCRSHRPWHESHHLSKCLSHLLKSTWRKKRHKRQKSLNIKYVQFKWINSNCLVKYSQMTLNKSAGNKGKWSKTSRDMQLTWRQVSALPQQRKQVTCKRSHDKLSCSWFCSLVFHAL